MGKNVPHAFISKISMLSFKCDDIFQGEVNVVGVDGLLHCELKNRAVKIDEEGKVRYFIELEKGRCWMEEVKGKNNRGLLRAVRKDKEIGL